MRQPIAISLILLFLFSALVPVQAKDQLGKLPSLMEHFREHVLTSPNLTFFQFVELHYGDDFAKHKKEHDHSNMPIKSACHDSHSTTSMVLPIQRCLSVSDPVSNETHLLSNSDQSYSFLLLSDIWQPPKL